MKKLNYLLIITISLFSSCVEKIEPNLQGAEPRLVVEGLVTNQHTPYVKLSLTNSFYSTESAPIVENALVIISDNAGNTDTLTYNPDFKKYYADNLTGTTGNIYYLKILYQGTLYEASAPMLPVTSIDSVFTNYYEKADFLHQQGYYLAFIAQEPQTREDFYLWKFYRNDSLIHEPDDIHIASDVGINENIVGLEGPYNYQLGDLARVEMYSLTEEAFNFYESLNNNINNDGGFFSSPPANPPSNISNGALGLFQVSSVDIEQMEVK